jgi:hypothetical protein
VPDERPRLGPWLRHYAEREQKSPRERAQELLLAAGAAVGFLVVLVGVLLAFIAYPVPTLGGLVGLWAVGFVVLVFKRKKAAAREHEMHAHAGLWDKRPR